MRKQSVPGSINLLTNHRPVRDVLSVLAISPLDEDHVALASIISHSTWMLSSARNLRSAIDLLSERDTSVILCERDLVPGTYWDVLEHTHDLPHPPSLIVASRLADNRLWAEALNLGAWDVLVKPFDRCEVLRSVKSAWQHRYHQMALHATAVKTMAAAG